MLKGANTTISISAMFISITKWNGYWHCYPCLLRCTYKADSDNSNTHLHL